MYIFGFNSYIFGFYNTCDALYNSFAIPCKLMIHYTHMFKNIINQFYKFILPILMPYIQIVICFFILCIYLLLKYIYDKFYNDEYTLRENKYMVMIKNKINNIKNYLYKKIKKLK